MATPMSEVLDSSCHWPAVSEVGFKNLLSFIFALQLAGGRVLSTILGILGMSLFLRGLASRLAERP